MRVVPREWRTEGVLESLNNSDIKAIVDEAEYAENQGYYDEDGNWVYYEVPPEDGSVPPQEEKVPEPTKPTPQPTKPQQQVPQKPQPNQAQKDEVKAAADEAAKAAQEAAKAAKEASQSLAKGFASFGFGGGNKKQSGGLFGGLMKAATVEPPKPQQVNGVKPAAAIKKEPPKPQVKPQDPKFLKPYTNNMTAKQRWHWAHRRIVQVFGLAYVEILFVELLLDWISAL